MKTCCIISAFDPMTTSQFNAIKALLKQGYGSITLSMVNEQPVQRQLVKAYIKPFKKIHYQSNININDYDLVVKDSDDQLAHMQRVRYGWYWDMPQWAANILNDSGIYYDQMLRHSLKEKRYLHSLSVANVCEKIAKSNQLNGHKAKMIGMLHDICKHMDNQTIIEYALKMDSNALSYPMATLHAQAGAYFVKEYLRIKDPQIIHAIQYHALGEKVSPYVRMVFVADKADPSRGYDSSVTLNLSYLNLTKGYARCKQESIEFLTKNHKI